MERQATLREKQSLMKSQMVRTRYLSSFSITDDTNSFLESSIADRPKIKAGNIKFKGRLDKSFDTKKDQILAAPVSHKLHDIMSIVG